MDEFTFTSYLTSNIDADRQLLQHLFVNCNKRSYQKGEFPVRAGEICSFTFFVEKGLLRQYSIDERGKEHILNFAPEGWFVNDRESLYYNRPSQFFIEALEDTEVFIITEELIERIKKEIPEFSRFNTDLLHNHIRSLQNRINELLSYSAEKRYLSFIKKYPDILLRVPQSMVASYLGITPESLSRVRKQLAERNFKPKT